MDDLEFRLHVVEKLARIEEYTRPLPGVVADHGKRITDMENRHFRVTALAAAAGLVLGYITQPVAHVAAAIASIFRA